MLKLVRASKLNLCACASLVLIVSLVACTKGGTISGGSSSTVSAVVSVQKVYPSSQGATWTPIISANRFYIKGLALTVSGVCSRGIASLRVNEGGADYPETATCAEDGSWVFAKTFTSGQEGNKTLTFQGYDSSGAMIPGSSTTVDVRIDNTPPGALVITSPTTSPWSISPGATTYTISGTCTCTADAVSAITVGSTSFQPTGDTWSYVANVGGDTSSFTFYVWDLAGNQSAARTQVFAKNQIMQLAGAIPAAHVGDGTGTLDLDAALDPNPGPLTDPFSHYVLKTSLSYILNEEGHK